MMLCSPFAGWFYRILDCMGGCFGCCSKSTPNTAVDEPTNGFKIKGQTVQKPSMYEDYWWSTSTCDIDISALRSQRSFSSLSASNLMQGSKGSRSKEFEFINHGLRLWNQSRNQWVGSSKHGSHSQRIREPTLSYNATYESLLGTSRPFSRPVPLSEMVEFLVDVWEQEGLYD
ncbi:unnamed protein product [Rhodiola kirilowii]